MGYDGDEDKDKRPAWAKDGAFMVTRKLNNLVPEFDKFLDDHGRKVFPDIKPEDAALRLGARLFGRWKSGQYILECLIFYLLIYSIRYTRRALS